MVSVKNESVTRFLLENGADKTIKTRSGKTAYDLAKDQNAPQAVLQLLKINSKKHTTKHYTPLEQLTRNDFQLMWERKTKQNRVNHMSAKEAQAYCKNLKWAGFNDYRVPTLNEVKKISLKKPITDFVIDGIQRYYIDPKRFRNVSPSRHWVVLQNGNMGYYSFAIKRGGEACQSCLKNLVRCVRKDL